MKVVAYTDVIQVAVLIIGGLVTSYIALTTVGHYFGFGENAIAGFKVLMRESSRAFQNDYSKTNSNFFSIEINKYLTFPGMTVLFSRYLDY